MRKWANSPIFPSHYKVSDDGLVYSVRSNKIIRPNADKFGYLYYVLCVAGQRKTVKAHRLVAMCFIDNPMQKPTVDHINGDRTDNRVSNLRWATNFEQTHNEKTYANLQNAFRRTDYKAMGSKRNFGRRKTAIYKDNCFVGVFNSLLEAAEQTKTNYSKLSEVANGKRNHTNGFVAVFFEEDSNEID